MAYIDKQMVRLELESIDPILKSIARNIVRGRYFEPAVSAMQKEFEEHKVTQELDAGNESSNLSGTLMGGSLEKNLYSFIGFNEGEKPTNAIRNRLREASAAGPKLIDLPVKKRSFIYQFDIQGPNLEAIYDETPLPWAKGLSWAQKIESFIPGLARFLPRAGEGRSGGGVQASRDVRKTQFKPVKYLSGLVENFIKRLTQ